MMTKEFIAIEKQLLSSFPGFSIKGSMMFISPVEHILRGFDFDPSGFDKKSFYVTTVVMPLCIPTNHLYFNFGERVRHVNGRDGWHADEPNLLTELIAALKLHAVPFLSHVESLLDFVELARSFSGGNPHTPKAIAFALARAGRNSEAVEVLDQLLNQVNLEVPWQCEIADMAKSLKSQLLSDPAAAQRQLDAWEAETVKNLGLEEFR